MSTEPTVELVVAHKEPIADDVVRLRLREPAGAPLAAWQPGAHVDLMLGNGLVRQYSLCGDPDDVETYTVAVLRETHSRGGSMFVHDALREGDHLRIRGPRNHFGLTYARTYLFIAGGIGITPLLPMIEAVARGDAQWRLVYIGRTGTSMAFGDELQAAYPGRVHLLPKDEYGRTDVTALLTGPRAVDPATAVYVCGPETMVKALEQSFVGRPAELLHVERFAPAEPPDRTTGSVFEVELASSGEVLQVPVGSSIAEVLRAGGVDVETSCEEGVCGTCETRVLAGDIDHRDSLLTEAERTQGKTMLICVSRARVGRLVLDL